MDDRLLAFVFRLLDREPESNQPLARLRRQRVEAFAHVLEIGRQRHAEFAQFVGALDVLGEDFLLDARRDRLSVGRCRKAKKVLGRAGLRDRDDIVDAFEGHVRQRERDDDLDRRAGRVEEAIGDANLLRRNREVFRPQLDRVVLGQNQTAGGKLGAGIVGARLDRRRHRDGEC
jgi:hypothetical protein